MWHDSFTCDMTYPRGTAPLQMWHNSTPPLQLCAGPVLTLRFPRNSFILFFLCVWKPDPVKQELYSFIFNKSAPEVAALFPIYFDCLQISSVVIGLYFSFGVLKSSTVNCAKTVNSSATTEKGGATTESRRRLELCVCIQGTRIVHKRDMTHSYEGNDSLIWGTWLIHMRDMTHSYEGHDSFQWGTWLIPMRDMTHSYE